MKYFAPGFASPTDAQSCFRGILQALSTPGVTVTFKEWFSPPPGLSGAAASVLLTLVDSSVSASLPEGEAARDWLLFHTGTRLTAPGQADFVMARDAADLRHLRQGTDDAPEDGATVILDVASLTSGQAYRLTGPGIETEQRVTLPLTADFLSAWRAQTRTAPHGVDVILCAGTQIIGLPRSLTIEEI